ASFGASNRKCLDDVLDAGQFSAGVKVAPGVGILIGKTAEAIALYHGDIFDGGMRLALGLIIVFSGSVGHALIGFLVSGWIHQTVGLIKISKSCCPELAGQ